MQHYDWLIYYLQHVTPTVTNRIATIQQGNVLPSNRYLHCTTLKKSIFIHCIQLCHWVKWMKTKRWWMAELCFGHFLFTDSHILTYLHSFILWAWIWCHFIDIYLFHDPSKQSESWYVDLWQISVLLIHEWYIVFCLYFLSSVIHELVFKFKDKLVILYHDHCSFMYFLILFKSLQFYDNLLASWFL